MKREPRRTFLLPPWRVFTVFLWCRDMLHYNQVAYFLYYLNMCQPGQTRTTKAATTSDKSMAMSNNDNVDLPVVIPEESRDLDASVSGLVLFRFVDLAVVTMESCRNTL
jgi:hypothetical protein